MESKYTKNTLKKSHFNFWDWKWSPTPALKFKKNISDFVWKSLWYCKLEIVDEAGRKIPIVLHKTLTKGEEI